MPTLPGRRLSTLQVWPDEDEPLRWRYLPMQPRVQKAGSGRASFTLIDAGGMVMLTLGAELAPSEDALFIARDAVAKDLGVEPDKIDLRPAEATATAAELILISAPGAGEKTIARARPSPLPPHPAAFSAMLAGDAGVELTSALAGGTGKLVVRYALTLPGQHAATATIRGDWADDEPIDAALDAARLHFDLTADAGASADLMARVTDLARAAAVEAALRMTEGKSVAQPDPRHATNAIDVSVTRSERTDLPVQIEADIAALLK